MCRDNRKSLKIYLRMLEDGKSSGDNGVYYGVPTVGFVFNNNSYNGLNFGFKCCCFICGVFKYFRKGM